jgi:hypothetical protein
LDRVNASFLLDGLVYGFGKAGEHAVAGAVGKNKIIRDVRNSPQVKEQDIFSNFFFKRGYNFSGK